jgi:hypothetical protein
VHLEAELRDALAALLRAREALPGSTEILVRDVVAREIASAQTSISRVLHLIAGSHKETP